MAKSPYPVTRTISALTATIESDRRFDAVVDRLQKACAKVVDRPPFVNILSGRSLGHPAHPMLVQMPIGCWSSACVLDFLPSVANRRVARTLLGVGNLSVLPAVASGLLEWVHTRDAERRFGVVHAASNLVATGLFTVSWWQRRARPTGGRTASFAGLIVASFGGWLGGHLAYSRGVGVNTAAFQSLPPRLDGGRETRPTHAGRDHGR